MANQSPQHGHGRCRRLPAHEPQPGALERPGARACQRLRGLPRACGYRPGHRRLRVRPAAAISARRCVDASRSDHGGGDGGSAGHALPPAGPRRRRPATASSAAARGGQGLLDSDPATHWTSAAGDVAPWWGSTWGRSGGVHRVAVAWEPVYGSGYDVPPRDALAWRTVAEVTCSMVPQDLRTTIPTRRARYAPLH